MTCKYEINSYNYSFCADMQGHLMFGISFHLGNYGSAMKKWPVL
jgi:hypothetical protein